MRGLRPYGLVGLYVGAQLVALLLAFPFLSAGLSSTSNPNSAADPIAIILVIVAAPLALLWLIRFRGAISALRALLLLAIGASLDVTVTAAAGVLLPVPGYVMPYGAGIAIYWAVPIGALVAVASFVTLLMEPQWYVVDGVGFLAGGALTALLGISFGILPCFILLGALAVYDFIAVYRTKHMIRLADVVTEMKLPILMVMPDSAGFDYTASPSLNVQRGRPVEEREALYMGLGDVVIPGTLVVSAFVWLPAHAAALGIGSNLLTALGAMVGSLVGYAILMGQVSKGNPQAGLPFLNGGAILGYAVTFLLLFHNPSLGLSGSL
jgi:presenilin-like A22 family membrane protease